MTLDEALATLRSQRDGLRRVVAEATELADRFDAALHILEEVPKVSPPGPIRESPSPPTPTVPPKRPAPAANLETFTGFRRNYTDAEKAEAVALARQVGTNEASKTLGVHQTTLNAWRRAAAQQNPVRIVPRKPPVVEIPVIKQPATPHPAPAPEPDDPERPYVCTCGARFDTANRWSLHRSQPGVTGRHLLAEQPARTFDDDLDTATERGGQ